MSASDCHRNTIAVAAQLADLLESKGQEYALGGAIALAYWGVPRGTVDVDLTLFLSPDQPSECVWLLEDMGCECFAAKAIENLREHGFCRVTFSGVDIDVFLPIVSFYEAARRRRQRVELAGVEVAIWDAETLCVFKMMFFRRKDLADIEQILRSQATAFDRDWVREQLGAMYGARDPRLPAWDDLVAEVWPQ